MPRSSGGPVGGDVPPFLGNLPLSVVPAPSLVPSRETESKKPVLTLAARGRGAQRPELGARHTPRWRTHWPILIARALAGMSTPRDRFLQVNLILQINRTATALPRCCISSMVNRTTWMLRGYYLIPALSILSASTVDEARTRIVPTIFWGLYALQKISAMVTTIKDED